MTDEALLKRLKDIKEWEKKAAVEKKEIIEQLLNRATFKDGCATGHLYGGNLHCTIQKKTTTTYNQDLLAIAMQKIGEVPFEAVFKREYKPRSKAALRNFFSTANDDQKKLIQDAMEEKEATPYVQLEPLDEVDHGS
jgi:hypothetical protein